MVREVFCAGALAVVFLTSGFSAHGQEWGFSSPAGAVVNVVRHPNLSVSGTLSLPSGPAGDPVRVPVSGRNESGKLILEFTDPLTGSGGEITYARAKSADGAYAVWRANDAPDLLRELRAPINVSGGSANSALENWVEDKNAVVGVDAFATLLKAHRDASAKAVSATETNAEVAIVADRPMVAAWDGAASRIGTSLTSIQTFSNQKDGVVFTMRGDDLVAALDQQRDLLRDFGGVAGIAGEQAAIPVRAIPNLDSYSVPLANLFDVYAVSNFDISRIDNDLKDLVRRLKGRRLQCAVGDPSTAAFTISCMHHCGAHRLQGNFLVNTIFTFLVGETRLNARQIFIMADSWGATAKPDDPTPGPDRFRYVRADRPDVDAAHKAAVEELKNTLGEMFKGFRRN